MSGNLRPRKLINYREVNINTGSQLESNSESESEFEENSSFFSTNSDSSLSDLDATFINLFSSNDVMPDTLNISLAERLIPSFNGKTGDIYKFIEMGQLMADSCTSEQDKNYFKMIILGKLESTAFELARSIDHLSWEELKIHLEQRFSESKSVVQLQLELTQQKQKSDIKEFSTRLLLILGSRNRAINATEGMQLDQTVRTTNNPNSKFFGMLLFP
jgi:hypothetical protein